MTASSAAVRRVLDALERGGQAPRANGAGWAVRCPAHDDGVASLSVNEGEDGRALLCCHAGCATADIVAALGLKLADLFEAPRANVRETRYEVRDASGVLVAVHVRRDGLEGKRFHWERDGKPTLGGIRVTSLPLYASELVHGWPVGEPVFIVEGEKAADALRRHSFNVVATVCGAASCPTAAVLEVLRGRDVVLWPDADEPGRRHMQKVAARLEGIAARVRLFEWAEAPERGDAADYFAQGGAAEALRATLEGASQSIPPRSGEVSKTQPARAMEANPEPAGRKKRLLARQGRELAFADPDPWPEPVDGATLTNDLLGTFRRFVALPPGADVALALWTLHAHAHEAFEVSPVLGLTSPEKRCGKTTTLRVLGALVPRPLLASSVSTAALFRTIERYKPTFLVDEADSFLRDNEELRGALNSGHHRALATFVRTVGEDFESRAFSTWCPKAIALIGRLAATLEDRAILIPMRRRAPGEPVERMRLDRLGKLGPLCRRGWRWTQDRLDDLRGADPVVPEQLDDRAADNWRPLLAIADALGGDWPVRAREAALALSGTASEADGTPALLLLADLRTLFDEKGRPALASAEIINALVKGEDRQWAEWKKGKPLSQVQLARMLKPFGVQPRAVWVEDHTLRGYARADFEDAFRRYLPSKVQDPQDPAIGADETQSFESQGGTGPLRLENAVPPAIGAGSCALADRKPEGGRRDGPCQTAGVPPAADGGADERLTKDGTRALLDRYGWEPAPGVEWPAGESELVPVLPPFPQERLALDGGPSGADAAPGRPTESLGADQGKGTTA